MNDPDRLLHSGSPEEMELLRSAGAEGPSRASRARTLAALGLVSGVLAVTTTASVAAAAGAATGVACAGGGIAGGGTLAKSGILSAGTGFASIAKWLGIGLAGTAVVVGGAYEVRSSFDEAGHAGSPAARVVSVERSAGPAAPIGQAPAPEMIADEARAEEATQEADVPVEATEMAEAPVAPPVEPHAHAAPPKPVPPTEVLAPAAPTLADEVASLDEARAALASGHAHDAVALLEGHGHKFKGGALGPEAEVLSIEVLVQSSAHERAIAAAEAFLVQHPASPHRARVQSLLAASRAALAPQQSPLPQ